MAHHCQGFDLPSLTIIPWLSTLLLERRIGEFRMLEIDPGIDHRDGDIGALRQFVRFGQSQPLRHEDVAGRRLQRHRHEGRHDDVDPRKIDGQDRGIENPCTNETADPITGRLFDSGKSSIMLET